MKKKMRCIIIIIVNCELYFVNYQLSIVNCLSYFSQRDVDFDGFGQASRADSNG